MTFNEIYIPAILIPVNYEMLVTKFHFMLAIFLEHFPWLFSIFAPQVVTAKQFSQLQMCFLKTATLPDANSFFTHLYWTTPGYAVKGTIHGILWYRNNIFFILRLWCNSSKHTSSPWMFFKTLKDFRKI